MNIRDYTFADYERLLNAGIENGYTFHTIQSYLTRSDPDPPFAIIRHDVDRQLATARAMAQIEAERDVTTTYYFRTSTFDPSTVREMAAHGHEIGYHYEDLVKTRGDHEAAHDRFAANLSHFREHADIQTVCPHGSPLSPHHNLDLWDGEQTLETYGLVGEAYLSMDTSNTDTEKPSYVSDTGRTWETEIAGFGRIRTTDDLIAGIESDSCNQLCLLVHPGRWSGSRTRFAESVVSDLIAEGGKPVAQLVHRGIGMAR